MDLSVGRYRRAEACSRQLSDERGLRASQLSASAYCLTVTAGFVALQVLAHRKSAPQFSRFAASTRDNVLACRSSRGGTDRTSGLHVTRLTITGSPFLTIGSSKFQKSGNDCQASAVQSRR